MMNWWHSDFPLFFLHVSLVFARSLQMALIPLRRCGHSLGKRAISVASSLTFIFGLLFMVSHYNELVAFCLSSFVPAYQFDEFARSLQVALIHLRRCGYSIGKRAISVA